MSWRDQAVCASLPLPTRELDRMFFGSSTSAAIRLCSMCPVADECLADALALPKSDDYGVRGGFTDTERRAMRRGEFVQRKPRPCRRCGALVVSTFSQGRPRELCDGCREPRKAEQRVQRRLSAVS